MSTDDLHKAIALTLVKNVGPVISKNLISYCGGLDAIFLEKKSRLLKIPHINVKIYDQLNSKEILKRAEKEIAFIERHKIQTYYFLSNDYPARLKHFPDAPILLYFKGSPVINHRRTLAIVGTRKITQNGRAICESIIKDLVNYDVCVFSGLAYGVDTHAHKNCVHMQIPTIGVLGHGLDLLYPSENIKLAKKMVQNGGILTEFLSGTKPEAMHFPQRNRVVAMLSDAVLVVESGESGGSMITADFAFQYNKDVFAIPGHPDDAMSKGCNLLIKQNKASLVENVEDIAKSLSWTLEKESKQKAQMSLSFEFTEEESQVMNLLKGRKAIELDSIHYRTSYPLSRLSSILLNLEFKGIIKTLPGKKYILS